MIIEMRPAATPLVSSYLFLIPAALGLFIALSCKTPPIISNPPKPILTRHDYHWVVDTLGDYGGLTELYDVAIISDTDIWAVGHIEMKDSTGMIDYVHPYNAAHWDGTKWTLERIKVRSLQYIEDWMVLENVFVAQPNDIWFIAEGGGQTRLINGKWTLGDSLGTAALSGRVWGTSSSNIYFVGGTGIEHYNGATFEKISSGTKTIALKDVWGDYSPKIGGYDVLCLLSNGNDVKQGRQLLRISGNLGIGYSTSRLSDSGLPNDLAGLWFKSGEKYMIVGDGIYQKHDIESAGSWDTIPWRDAIDGYVQTIAGLDTNDIFLAGAYGTLSHYNGQTWRKYYPMPGINVGYSPVKMLGDFVVVAGGTLGAVGQRGIVLRGH